tara:strand:- start:516 stop:1247 length:732 start_codon:yes stop_codon:yes gene_type:complete
MSKNKKVLSTKMQKRLLKDVADIMKNNLSGQGIYYIHDDENILKGYALLFGPEKTPYQNGAYCVEFNFPSDYPFSPPTLKYLTNDGKTRFNPNLYRNGKVCLSVLNTWRGEQWTSCQTIRSILLTLITILNEKPLLNEPGIKKTNPQVKTYNKILKYRNYETAIYNVLRKKQLPNKHISFYPIVKKYFIENKDKILKNIKKDYEKFKKTNNESYNMNIYNMSCIPNYEQLIQNLNDEFDKIKN